MALIDIARLTFAHDGERPLFNNVSLQLDTGWKLGLLGRNGRGKTTFLKLLCGAYPYSGVIHTPLAMEYFPFAVNRPEASGRVAARSLCPEMEDWRLEREVSLLDFAPEALDRPFVTLSGGEATKLLLAILFLRNGAFPLIDEPTNHLDAKARRVVGDYLRGKRGFILVSHDRALLDGCVDHVLSINRTSIELQRGNFSSWRTNRERRDQRELAEHETLEKEITRLEHSASRSAGWSRETEKGKYGQGPVDRGFIGRKAAKMMQRAKSVEFRRLKAVEDTSLLLRDLETEAPLSMRPLRFHNDRLAELNAVSVNYGDAAILRDVSFRIMHGDRLALNGGNGSGKSTLLRLLAGAEAEQKAGQEKHAALSGGTLHLPGSLRVSYVPQDVSSLRGRLKDFIRERGVEENLFRAVLDRFGFERGRFDPNNADMGDFSTGQKKKALLAASLCQEAHLYIWDEPLNSVDVISRVQIENLILACRPTMILVEHDRMFVQRVATAVFDLEGSDMQ